MFIRKIKLFEPSSDLCCEDAGRQRYRSQEETVDFKKDGGIYRRQQVVQTSLHVNTSKHTWNTFTCKYTEYTES